MVVQGKLHSEDDVGLRGVGGTCTGGGYAGGVCVGGECTVRIAEGEVGGVCLHIGSASNALSIDTPCNVDSARVEGFIRDGSS